MDGELDGASAPQASDASPSASPPPAESAATPSSGFSAAEGKECRFCGEIIASFADRCSHCAGFLPIVEGRAFKQHFFFFVASLAMFIGTLLPWEGQWLDSYGFLSKGGAFLLVFSAYGMVATFFNLFHRQMIVWPVLFAALDGVFFGWMRVFAILNSDTAKAMKFDTKSMATIKDSLSAYLDLFGPGLYLVVFFASIFWVVFFIGIVQGGRAVAARKEAEKASRSQRGR
jgi:hypothetical protein